MRLTYGNVYTLAFAVWLAVMWGVVEIVRYFMYG